MIVGDASRTLEKETIALAVALVESLKARIRDGGTPVHHLLNPKYTRNPHHQNHASPKT